MSTLADIITITLFPVTLYQIITLQSRIQKAQRNMNQILQFKEYQIIRKILEVVFQNNKELIKIISYPQKKGVRKSTVFDMCRKIVESLNNCCVEIPSKYVDLMDTMHSCTKELQKYYLVFEEHSCLQEAQEYLYSCIKQLKMIDSNLLKEEIELIASSK